MRLLAHPIYHYENTKGDLIDGGLFAFVQGTDPEVFLLVEARRPGGLRPRVEFRRDPNARHRSAAQSPRAPDMERPRNSRFASVRHA